MRSSSLPRRAAIAAWVLALVACAVVLARVERVESAGVASSSPALERFAGGGHLSALRVVLRARVGTFEEGLASYASRRALSRVLAAVPGAALLSPLDPTLADLVTDDRQTAMATLRLPLDTSEAASLVKRIRGALAKTPGIDVNVGGAPAEARDRSPTRAGLAILAWLAVAVLAGLAMTALERGRGLAPAAAGAAGGLVALAAMALLGDGVIAVEGVLTAIPVATAVAWAAARGRRAGLWAAAAAMACALPWAVPDPPALRAAAVGALLAAPAGALAGLTLAPALRGAAAPAPRPVTGAQRTLALLSLAALLLTFGAIAARAADPGDHGGSARAATLVDERLDGAGDPGALVIDAGAGRTPTDPVVFALIGEVAEEMRSDSRVAWPTTVRPARVTALRPRALISPDGRLALIEVTPRSARAVPLAERAAQVGRAIPGATAVAVPPESARRAAGERAATRALWTAGGVPPLLVGLLACLAARRFDPPWLELGLVPAAIGLLWLASGGAVDPVAGAAVAVPALCAAAALAMRRLG